MSKMNKYEAYRGVWYLIAFFCFLSGIPSLAEYMKSGVLLNPRGPFYLTGTDAIVLLVGLLGMGIISVVGITYCNIKLRKIKQHDKEFIED